jgi:proteic killer suppression protein
MIRSFRHKGLKRLYEDDDHKGVLPELSIACGASWGTWIRRSSQPTWTCQATRLQPLKGARKENWSITVSGNWRVTFRFEGTDIAGVNYEDYH